MTRQEYLARIKEARRNIEALRAAKELLAQIDELMCKVIEILQKPDHAKE